MIIGKLNYLAMLMCHDIQFVAHSCARYSTFPKQKHEEVVEYIDRYLKGMSKVEMPFHPKRNEAFNQSTDADFTGNWLQEYVKSDPTMAKSRSGWVITYANFSNSVTFQDVITGCPHYNQGKIYFSVLFTVRCYSSDRFCKRTKG